MSERCGVDTVTLKQMRIKEWNKLEFHDSRKVLVNLHELQERVASSNLPPELKNLRSRELKKYLEGRQAALFCYGISAAVINTKIYHALSEASDYDCIARWIDNEAQSFTPIQLKELVPEALNSKTTLAKELEKLNKYASSEDLVIALHVNRAGRLDFSEIQIPELKVAEVWLYGGLSPDQSRWFLFGNMLKDPQYYEFSYPDI